MYYTVLRFTIKYYDVVYSTLIRRSPLLPPSFLLSNHFTPANTPLPVPGTGLALCVSSTVLYCTVLYFTVLYFVLYSTILYVLLQYNMVQYSTALYITVLHSTVGYSAH